MKNLPGIDLHKNEDKFMKESKKLELNSFLNFSYQYYIIKFIRFHSPSAFQICNLITIAIYR